MRGGSDWHRSLCGAYSRNCQLLDSAKHISRISHIRGFSQIPQSFPPNLPGPGCQAPEKGTLSSERFKVGQTSLNARWTTNAQALRTELAGEASSGSSKAGNAAQSV